MASKTGGGVGTNQYEVKGRSVDAARAGAARAGALIEPVGEFHRNGSAGHPFRAAVHDGMLDVAFVDSDDNGELLQIPLAAIRALQPMPRPNKGEFRFAAVWRDPNSDAGVAVFDWKIGAGKHPTSMVAVTDLAADPSEFRTAVFNLRSLLDGDVSWSTNGQRGDYAHRAVLAAFPPVPAPTPADADAAKDAVLGDMFAEFVEASPDSTVGRWARTESVTWPDDDSHGEWSATVYDTMRSPHTPQVIDRAVIERGIRLASERWTNMTGRVPTVDQLRAGEGFAYTDRQVSDIVQMGLYPDDIGKPDWVLYSDAFDLDDNGDPDAEDRYRD
jgi:hypothetical protein